MAPVLQLLDQLCAARHLGDLAALSSAAQSLPRLEIGAAHAGRLLAAAAAVLRVVAASQPPPSGASAELETADAVSCAAAVCGAAVHAATATAAPNSRPPASTVDAFEDLMQAAASAGRTAETELMQRWSGAQRDSRLALAWLALGGVLLQLGHVARSSATSTAVFRRCAPQLTAMLSLNNLALAVIRSDAALAAGKAGSPAAAWGAAIAFMQGQVDESQGMNDALTEMSTMLASHGVGAGGVGASSGSTASGAAPAAAAGAMPAAAGLAGLPSGLLAAGWGSMPPELEAAVRSAAGGAMPWQAAGAAAAAGTMPAAANPAGLPGGLLAGSWMGGAGLPPALAAAVRSAAGESNVITLGPSASGAQGLDELFSLLLSMQAAALHAHRAGASSCIAADPVAAAGLGSSSSSSSGSSSVAGSSQAPSLLAVPALHKALLRQVPLCLDMMLQQPAIVAALLPGGGRAAMWESVFVMTILKAGVKASNGTSLVPLLQVLVEVAVLADSPAHVCGAVNAMVQLALSPAVRSSGPASSTDQGLQPAQAAGLLAPVLHLLSAAVLHVLGPPAGGAPAADSEQLSSEEKATLAGQFASLVAAVVLPVEGKHLAAAISQQPLRTLAVLEMTLRQWAAGLVPQLAGAVSGPCSPPGTPPLVWMAATVADACRMAVGPGKLAAALQGSDSTTASLASNHLAALLATCFKVSVQCSSAGGSDTVRNMAGSIVSYVGLAAVGLAGPAGTWQGSSSSNSSSSHGTISRCNATHWLFLVGRSLAEYSAQLMQSMALTVLAKSIGVRAMLGLQEGEVGVASAAHAAAVVRAAARAATCPGAATQPHTGSHSQAAELTGQQQVDEAAAAAGGTGLMSLCAGLARQGGHAVSMAVQLVQLASESLVQLAHSNSSNGSSSSATRAELLQQLAQAASDMSEQLFPFWCRAMHDVYSCISAAEADGRSGLDAYTDVVLQGCDGVSVLVDSGGQPIVKQHALLNVLHHLQRLQRLGEAVCAALPPPSLACANPGCDNVSGLSDMQLVWRRGVCGHCGEARFCSVACLRAHWAAHHDPSSLVEAVVPGGGGGGGV